MRGLTKNCMGRGQTETHTHTDKRTSRLLERIGLRADSLKKVPARYKVGVMWYCEDSGRISESVKSVFESVKCVKNYYCVQNRI